MSDDAAAVAAAAAESFRRKWGFGRTIPIGPTRSQLGGHPTTDAVPEYGELGLAWVPWCPHSGMRGERSQFGSSWAFNEVAAYASWGRLGTIHWRMPDVQELIHVSITHGAVYRELFPDGYFVWTEEGLGHSHALAVELGTGELSWRYRVDVENVYCRFVRPQKEVEAIGEILD